MSQQKTTIFTFFNLPYIISRIYVIFDLALLLVHTLNLNYIQNFTQRNQSVSCGCLVFVLKLKPTHNIYQSMYKLYDKKKLYSHHRWTGIILTLQAALFQFDGRCPNGASVENCKTLYQFYFETDRRALMLIS